MKIWFILLAVSFLYQVTEAKTLLISDIDDTIKNSHILDKSESARTTVDTENIFLGMNWAYQLLKKEDAQMKFYYISNAPEFLLTGKHAEFLSLNKFPAGEILMRKSMQEKEHKVKSIRTILQREKPSLVLLVGDNGERDIPIYYQIAKEFPRIQFLTWIHMAYWTQSEEETGVAVLERQVPIMSALDFTISLQNHKLLSTQSLNLFVKAFSPAVLQEDLSEESDQALAFPDWKDCRDVRWSVDDSSVAKELRPIYSKAKARVLERCSVPGSEN